MIAISPCLFLLRPSYALSQRLPEIEGEGFAASMRGDVNLDIVREPLEEVGGCIPCDLLLGWVAQRIVLRTIWLRLDIDFLRDLVLATALEAPETQGDVLAAPFARSYCHVLLVQSEPEMVQ